MTDRDEAGLRGPVHTCTLERDYVYPDRHWVMYTDETFSPNGHLLEQRHLNPDGSRWSAICRYDAQDRLLRKQHVSASNEKTVDHTYLYDDLGRLERVLAHAGTALERVQESFLYLPDGTKTQTIYPPPLDVEQRKTTAICSSSLLHLSIDAVAIMTLFDAAGRPVRKVLYDIDDRVIRRVAFRYNQQGLLLEEGELIAGRVREDFRNVYRYDPAGRLIESDQSWGDFGGRLIEYSYNPEGAIAEEHTTPRRCFTDGRHVDPPFTHRYQYRYDDRDNWTERVTETILDNAEPRVSMVERRTLAYY